MEIVKIPGFTGYGASADGRLWSAWRPGSRKMWPWKELRPRFLNHAGYLRTIFKDDAGARVYRGVHWMVCLAFHGAPPEGMQPNHKNGNKLDNRADNLEWVTGSENIKHAFRSGLKPRPFGERNGMAKLTQEQIEDCRARKLSKQSTVRGMAAELGVHEKHLSACLSGRFWNHLGDSPIITTKSC